MRERLDQNPLRAFDADHPGTQAVMAQAPRLLDRLEADDAEHFAAVRALLDAAGMSYEVDSTLVRGLDYYTRTVFEFESERLGAQAALGGGGRYDRLIEELGGPPTPGVGWAAGVERILLASDGEPEAGERVYIALAKPDLMADAFALARRLRAGGVRVEIEQAGRSLKGQLKQADRIGARRDRDPRRRDRREGHGERRAERGGGTRRGGGAGGEGAAMKAPRPNRYRDRWAGELRAGDVGQTPRVAGWVHRRRDHGGLIFIDLRDRTGLLQLVFRPEEAPEAHAAAGRLRAEDVISAGGELLRREEGTINPNLPTGEVELAVSEFDLLADAETPPFQIDEDEPVGEELRLRYRYLDLRKQRMRDTMVLRHDVVKTIRDHLSDEGFLEIETPILTRSTPEGARDFLVPSRLTQGSWYALPQSPQLFKQLLMMGGLERYFQIPRCFRDEDFRADRQPEFTQLDVEMAFVEEEDVHALVDPLLERVLALGGIELELPLERLPYDEAMLRYGSDRPDRRLGVEIVDLTEVFRGSAFKVFGGAVESGGVVRAIRARGDFPRSRIDKLEEKAKSLGAKGLAWAVVEGGGWRSPIAKFLSEDEIARATAALEAREGDVILFGADSRGRCGARARRPARRRGRGQSRRATTASGSLTSRCSSGTRTSSASTRCTTPSRRRAATSTPTRAPGARAPTTWCSTAGSWAAARSGSTRRSCSRRSSTRWASAPRRPASASASCSRRSPTAPRRTAGSPSGSTASWRCWRAATRSAT